MDFIMCFAVGFMSMLFITQVVAIAYDLVEKFGKVAILGVISFLVVSLVLGIIILKYI